MGIELELKYRATPELLTRLRKEVTGKEKIFHMQTTYYDTPTGQFSARHCTLRCRLENDIYICTLKTPAGGVGRREWEVACDRIEDALGELCKLGAPEDILSLAGEGIIPICGARFTRIAKTLDLEDCVVELALDEGLLTGGGKEIPLCEVEVELKQGDWAACAAFSEKLARVYGLVPEQKSKFRRALALYRGEK